MGRPARLLGSRRGPESRRRACLVPAALAPSWPIPHGARPAPPRRLRLEFRIAGRGPFYTAPAFSATRRAAAVETGAAGDGQAPCARGWGAGEGGGGPAQPIPAAAAGGPPPLSPSRVPSRALIRSTARAAYAAIRVPAQRRRAARRAAVRPPPRPCPRRRPGARRACGAGRRPSPRVIAGLRAPAGRRHAVLGSLMAPPACAWCRGFTARARGRIVSSCIQGRPAPGRRRSLACYEICAAAGRPARGTGHGWRRPCGSCRALPIAGLSRRPPILARDVYGRPC